ncbi:selenocysteine insertion sequence-binding protein 2 isoform X3 [Panthera tigris]|uniref:selenocysteine insertion sequence-binding protein 2 isoform X3 n=1 Tax=Panthera tigris TaxID=9694 RepID=UPI001C6F888A|nr:selenocysteine insertion sequence-binding protein 2 isoform X3 [Panthera tigris]
MASEGPREPAGEGIKLSADVKPFVPKFAGLNVVWSESSEARVFPSCAAPYYPCAQELPGPEQKLYTEDVAFGASAFPPQYLSSELAVHPCSYSPYPVESTPRVCPVPGAPYAYGHPGCYRAFQTVKPRSEQKKTYDEQKFDSKKADGSLPSDLKSDGYHRRTDRRSRIIEKSASASKPEFEFTRMDFPELQGPENREIAETRKQPRWGPLRSASADLSLLGEVGEPAAGTAETLSTERPPAPKNVTSMINLKTVASSADPKSASMSPSEVFSADPSCKEKHVHPTKKSKASQGGDPEQNEASRKHKKKKEKSKSKYEVLTIQEPPRIEDAEDFPSLAAASERRDRGASPRLQSRQQPQNNFKNSGKKSQVPVQLDLGGMLAALEKKQHAQSARASSKPVVFSVGAVPVLSRDPVSGKKGHFSQVKTPHNPLDSSAPLMKKGKQREVPKAKKPTSLKKIILKERQERKQQRLQENTVSPAPASDAALDGESGGDEALEQAEPSGACHGLFLCGVAEGTEESAAPTPTGQRKSEEPPRTEPQKEADGLCLVPDGAGCPRIHSRRFRDYCSQMLSKEVDACVTDLLRELVRFQDRMYQKDPVKAKTKRRLVLGLREVLKHLKLRKLKCIIISPNCEKIQSKDGSFQRPTQVSSFCCFTVLPPTALSPTRRAGRYPAHHHRLCLRAEHPFRVRSQPQGSGAQFEQGRPCQRGGHLQLRRGPGPVPQDGGADDGRPAGVQGHAGERTPGAGGGAWAPRPGQPAPAGPPCSCRRERRAALHGNLERTPGSLQSGCPGAGGLSGGFNLADDEPELIGRLLGVCRVFGVRKGGVEDSGAFFTVLLGLTYSVWLFDWEANPRCASRGRAFGRAGGNLSKNSEVVALGL